MGYFVKEKFHLRASSEMIVSRLVAAVGFAVLAAVQSIFLRDFGFSDSNVGYVSAVAATIVVILSPLVPILLEKFNELKIYVISLIILASTFIGMSLATNVAMALILYISFFVVSMIFGNTSSVVFKDVNSSKKEFTKSQGLASSLMNLGWVIGPLLGGLVLAQYGIDAAFLFAAVFMLVSAAVLLVKPLKVRKKIGRLMTQIG